MPVTFSAFAVLSSTGSALAAAKPPFTPAPPFALRALTRRPVKPIASAQLRGLRDDGVAIAARTKLPTPPASNRRREFLFGEFQKSHYNLHHERSGQKHIGGGRSFALRDAGYASICKV
jgi:hypothetical protein